MIVSHYLVSLGQQRPTWLLWVIKWRYHLLFLLMSTLMVAFGIREGFEFAAVNHFRDQSVQLPILYSYADSSLFQNDILLEARDTYITWFYPALGVLSRAVPLYYIFLTVYLLAIGFMVGAVYYLAETLFPQRNVGLVAALLWTVWLPNPGGDFIHSAFPTHTTTAMGLQLLGLTLAIRRRYTPAALLIGFAANINAMTSFFMVTVWAMGMLSRRDEWDWKLIRIPLLLGLAAAPTLWWRFVMSTPAPDPAAMDTFVEIMRLRLWYAVFPFSVNILLWVAFAGVVGLWIYSARFARPETNRQVFWMIQGIVLLMVIGTVFTELYPVEFVIQLQLLRSTWILNMFAMLYFANMIAVWMQGDRRQVIIALGLTFVLALPRVVMEFVPLPQPVPYELYVDFDTARDGTRLTPLGAVGLFAIFGALLWLLWKMLPNRETHNKQRVLLWFSFASTALLMPLAIDTAIPPRQTQVAEDWQETLVWIRENTPQEASFVSPPTVDGFRVYAERTNFSDWKDGTLLIFNSELAVEWLHRMETLGFNRETFAFEPPTQADLCQVRAEYAMDYAVAFHDWDIGGDAVYANASFRVVPLDGLPCEVTLNSPIHAR